ncbi:hypothetical protein SAMN05216480_10470 [Pustulibacterium marinum]|uniref:Uncharacterized protein n=1 Tax=Pustulibacterium marinum TaxID=1224947 RepID=A0A1I7GBL1_9FLAO|nr:hypothetical protein [Pustulibacterium marinum]SFU45828.1 hypothetical protein SAMN05216480_10470 [Pustulibacterium marinum]
MRKLSTQNLDLLPNPNELRRICKSIAALEVIICPEWEYRYYSYQKDWSDTEEVCEMRNGQGDQMLILFSNNGICINGFAHESQMNGWKSIPIEEKKTFVDKLFGSKKTQQTKLIQEINKEVIDQLPEVFNEFIFGEPVKSIGTTFCIWKTIDDFNWTTGHIDFPNDDYKDGSSDLLQLLDGKAFTYKEWAEEYYEEEFNERELKIGLVEKIYNGAVITKDLVLEINPNLEDFEKLKSDLNEIGYENEI